VEIDGTGFAVAATPSPGPNGYTSPPPPTVAVSFGGVPALAVFVISAELVYAVSPPTAPTNDANGRGTLPTVVSVSVANIDANGVPLEGQTATLAAAFAYLLPDLTDQCQESDLARLVRTFLQLLKAQITPNVSWPKSTDFDPETADFLAIADLPALPGLVVTDLSLRTDDFYSRRDPYYVDNGDGTFTEKAPPDTVDLVFSVVGVSNNPPELLNLAAAFRRFLRKNPWVYMVRDPTGAVPGQVRYEMNWHEGRETKVTSTANASNLSHFAYDVSILGFDIEDMTGLPLGGPGDTGRSHEATIGISSIAETATLLPTFALPKGEELGELEDF
jgi:hypothetical protein